MPFQPLRELRLLAINAAVIFVSMIIMKLTVGPIIFYIFDAVPKSNMTDVDPKATSITSTDIFNLNTDLPDISSPTSITSFDTDTDTDIDTLPSTVAITTDALGYTPEGKKYVEFSDDGNGTSPEIGAGKIEGGLDGFEDFFMVQEYHDGILVMNETFWGKGAEGRGESWVEKRDLAKRMDVGEGTAVQPIPWTVQALPAEGMQELIFSGRRYTKHMLESVNDFNKMMEDCGRWDNHDLKWQREDWKKTELFDSLMQNWNYEGLLQEGEEFVRYQERFKGLRRDLQTLRIGTDDVRDPQRPWRHRRNVNLEFWPQGPNALISTKQDRPYFKRVNDQSDIPTRFKATNGYHTSVINPLDGIIVVYEALSPEYADMFARNSQTPLPKSNLPTLKQWSDVVYRQWAVRVRNWRIYTTKTFQNQLDSPRPTRINMESEEMIQWLNLIVIRAVTSPPETHQVIQTCIGSRGFVNSNIPRWENRQTFTVGHWCYHALLATKNCRGIVWLLAQHKASLGIKVPLSVTIWWSEGDDLSERELSYPNLLWEITNVNQQCRDKLKENEKRYSLDLQLIEVMGGWPKMDDPQIGAGDAPVGLGKAVPREGEAGPAPPREGEAGPAPPASPA